MALSQAELKERARQIPEAILNENDLELADELFADEYVSHNAVAPEPYHGPEGVKEFVSTIRTAFPDIEVTVEDVIAEGDTVVRRDHVTGTHEGTFVGIEPTGKAVEGEQIAILRVEDGEFVESWTQGDMLGIMQQLGVVDAPGEQQPTVTRVGDSAIDQFQETLRGRLVQPEDPEYDEARTIYNANIDKYPRLIAKCTNVADVKAAVDFGREQGLPTAVQGGGHNGAGLGLVDDGLVIDLSEMTGIRIDPDERTARVQAGCTWGGVDHATHAFVLATPSGVISTTGVSGLTLGGGHGYLSRKYGLTVDNLVRADVVLADGRLVTASETENPDLFWALRGGGGNFGVVTSFEFQLHPVSTVVAGPLFWPIDELESTMRWYREWLPEAPEDVYAFYMVAEVPGEPFPPELHGENVCGLMWCYLGPEDRVDDVMQPARDVADPLFEHVEEMPYPAVQSMFDDLYPPGDQWYWKGDFVYDLTDEAIAAHERFAEVPTPKSTMHLYPVDGAVHDVDSDETAFNYRDATWSMVIAGVDPDPANAEAITEWATEYWEAVHPHSADGSYVNFMMEEGEDRIRASYGDNYERLQQVKAKYDPDNFFHVNQNIDPAE